MLAYSDLTVYKNTDGITTALGCPINSFLLQNNKPLFVGGGKKKKADEAEHVAKAVVAHNAMGAGAHSDEVEETDYDNLAVPAGLVCMTQTTCHNVYATGTQAQAPGQESDVIPESLYDKLFALAETRPIKKHTRRNDKKDKKGKGKTHKKRD